MLCKFSEKECKYILKFKKEMVSKYNENKKRKENSDGSLSNLIFRYLNDY